MKFKKIYLEITNKCNLYCDFCIKNSRKIEELSFTNFKLIISKVKDYTNYLYFHVLGEPLFHPNINEFIDYAKENDMFVNITTNGYLINNINTRNIRQLNISLHSFDLKYNISINDYLENIFKKVDELKENTYISYRIWLKSKYTNEILFLLNQKYNKNLTKSILQQRGNILLDNNIFLSISNEFIWPNLDNLYYNDNGNCYALKDHIGILSNGDIIPCCLDSKGIIKLGNIYKDNIEDIMNSTRVKNMMQNFKNNKKCEELCKHCKFL